MIANSIFIKNIEPIMFSLIEVNADPESERLMIIDRKSGSLVANIKASSKSICWLPVDASTSSKFMVIILDDNEIYNAAIVDNVIPELVDIIKYNF